MTPQTAKRRDGKRGKQVIGLAGHADAANLHRLHLATDLIFPFNSKLVYEFTT